MQFFEAAAVEGHAQAPAFAALGRYFAEVGRWFGWVEGLVSSCLQYWGLRRPAATLPLASCMDVLVPPVCPSAPQALAAPSSPSGGGQAGAGDAVLQAGPGAGPFGGHSR